MDTQSGWTISLISESKSSSLVAEPCQVSQGSCDFKSIKIIAALNKSYTYKIDYRFDNQILSKNLSIYVTECSKGDIYIDSICYTCPENTFSLQTQFVTDASKPMSCERCPRSAKCFGGPKIIPREGFWLANENSSLVLECIVKTACPYQNTWENITEGPLVFKCEKGFYGNLCQMCELGYGTYRDGCFPCKDDQVQTFYLALKIIFALFLIALEVQSFISTRQISHKTIMKILVAHTNYMSSVSSADLKLSDEFKQVFGDLNNNVSVVPADIFDFHCLLKDMVSIENLFKANMSLKVLWMIFYTLMAYILFLIAETLMLIKEKKGRKLLEKMKGNFLETLSLTFLVCYRNMYPRVLLSTIGILKCKDLGIDSNLYLDSDPNIICWSQDHIALISGLMLTGLLLWSILVPCLIYRQLRKKRRIFAETPEESNSPNVVKVKSKSTYEIRQNESSTSISYPKDNTWVVDDSTQMKYQEPPSGKRKTLFFLLLFNH